MKGDKALWIPGTDHGGIATQNVVEKILKKEGKTRHDLGREKFLERMWAWRKESGDTILHQLRKLGCSLDWTRTRFTMDEASSRAVRRPSSIFSKGKVTKASGSSTGAPVAARRSRTSKWSIRRANPALWHIRYPFADGGDVVVATTRPETMLGDTAVAVNPEDERYADKRGKNLRLPLMDRRHSEIPLADAAVDAAFGTGAVKVTPPTTPPIPRSAPDKGCPTNGHRFDGKMTPAAGRLRGPVH
jgi:valyl-tRNA synthetase